MNPYSQAVRCLHVLNTSSRACFFCFFLLFLATFFVSCLHLFAVCILRCAVSLLFFHLYLKGFLLLASRSFFFFGLFVPFSFSYCVHFVYFLRFSLSLWMSSPPSLLYRCLLCLVQTFLSFHLFFFSFSCLFLPPWLSVCNEFLIVCSWVSLRVK